MAVEAFVRKHLHLLEIEHQAEIEENKRLQESLPLTELQRRGICLQKLRASSFRTGLFGRCCVNFEPYWSGKPLPSHSINTGDIVGIGISHSSEGRKILLSGVVSHVNQAGVTVAFDEATDTSDLNEDEQLWLIKLSNDVTYKRIKRALTNLDKQADSRSKNLISILFGERTPSDPLTVTTVDSKQFFNTKLDDSQKEAVRFALAQKEVAVVHGPPGTGKTTTVVEIIQQAVQMHLKILACAPSNIAVDNLVERLAANKVKIVRLGHPARLLSGIQKYALDAALSRSDEYAVIDDLRKDIDKLMVQRKKMRGKEVRDNTWQERKRLFKELKEREKKALKTVLQNADVVLGTLTSVSDDGPLKYLPPEHFNLVVIDECSQALEAACWIALPFGQKCVLAGDHLQLPPTIVSEKAAKEGLSVTLMERVLKLHGNSVMTMLTMQYRMHADIMQWASQLLYKNKLVAHSSVESHLLSDLSGVKATEDTSIPLLLIDTAGCGLWELELENEESQGNEGEADLVALYVERLVTSGVKPADIGVITPYNLQVELIKLRVSNKFPPVEVKSVDGFQGREKEAIVLSLVRSNERGEIGFLADRRRINVAVTRAKRHLAIICDTETVSSDSFLKSLVEYVSDRGDVRSAHQYESDLNLCEVSRPQHLQLKDATNKTNRSAVRKKKCKAQPSKTLAGETTLVHAKSKADKSQDGEETQIEVETLLIEFMNDLEKMQHSFPATLTAFERRIVHEVAEKMGLAHESLGEGSERHIVVRKKQDEIPLLAENVQKDDSDKPDVSEVPECLTDLPESAESQEHISIEEPKPKHDKRCKNCKKWVPLANFELHSVRCKKLKEEKNCACGQAQASAKKASQKNVLKDINLPDSEDLDELLASAENLNKICSFKSCKANITLIVQVCSFCKLGFCLSHRLPEVHGCEDSARAHARSERNSLPPQKMQDPVKKACLQKKLNEKLGDMSQKRKAKRK